MSKNRIDIYRDFAQNIEYPVVIFEAESGKVLEMNYDAEVLLGIKADVIRMEPGRALTSTDFWDLLRGKKSLMWHRICLKADEKEILVSGLVNEAEVDGTLVYTLLFERRADMNIGSVTLERIVNHANIIALHLYLEQGGYTVDYVSQNINHYGYTRAQLYEEQIYYMDIICEEDREAVKKQALWEIEKKQEDGVVECRIISEQQELIPVRLLMHYVYNEYGNIAAVEILCVDLSEELRKNRERNYLHMAIAKMKSVVLVKSYKGKQRKLQYISPNAEMIGMNGEALSKGYKLTEDYIHPEDRNYVIDTIYLAVDNGTTDYVQEYRMVRDDGRIIWVENDVTISRISDGEAEISFLLTDITARKELEQELAIANDTSVNSVVDYDAKLTDNGNQRMIERFQLVSQVLGRNAGYYTVLLDFSGKQLIHPGGPASDMGQFFDMFERPEFKEQFNDVSVQTREDPAPAYRSFRMDAFLVNIVFVPIVIEENVIAYWVMANFNDDGMEQLSPVVEAYWKLSNSIARYFYADELIENEVHHRKLVEMQLTKEQKERDMIESLISYISKDGIAAIGEICQKSGEFLNVTDIGIYTIDKKSGDVDIYYQWSQSEDDSDFFRKMILTASEYKVVKEHFKKNGILIADRQLQDPFLKEVVTRTRTGAIMLVEITHLGESKGYVMIADQDRNRLFNNNMIRFTKVLTDLFGRMLFHDEKGNKLELLHEGFLDAYNHIRDAVFIKDNRSGDIIFANKAADKLFGYSLEGRQSGEVINDKMEQYRTIQGVRRRLIADKKITKWQSYMKELDQIMNIVEVHLDTISGADCSLIVMKKSKNKDKKNK